MELRWFPLEHRRPSNREQALKYHNPEIPEGINTTETHPLKEFGFLISVVIGGGILLTLVLAFAVDLAAGYIPFEFEAALSESVVKNIDKKPDEVDQYLQSLADKLALKMDLPEGMSIHVHYVNEDIVNAMATLGGHVMVYRGLLEKLPNENALVMLLGHEIGHVKLRHPVKALGKGVVLGLLMSVILGESSDSVANAISDTTMLTMLSFSRDQEESSDEEGIKTVNAYYGHVQGATGLFEILQKASEDSMVDMPQFLNSHPDTENRINYLNKQASTQHWKLKGPLRPIPDNILKKLKADKQQESEVVKD